MSRYRDNSGAHLRQRKLEKKLSYLVAERREENSSGNECGWLRVANGNGNPKSFHVDKLGTKMNHQDFSVVFKTNTCLLFWPRSSRNTFFRWLLVTLLINQFWLILLYRARSVVCSLRLSRTTMLYTHRKIIYNPPKQAIIVELNALKPTELCTPI